jgi:ADP-ribose pyrophosphatase YjhB (NUDIX family)
LKKLIKEIESQIKNPSKGLPDDIFYFVGRLTPYINVDLLVKNDLGETLLSWRDEALFNNEVGCGWHIPGGIIRFQEEISERIREVALHELRAKLSYHSAQPISVNQVIDHKAKDRSHFISLLYECRLEDNYKINNENINECDVGFLKWHMGVPKNLLPNHYIYKKYLNNKKKVVG